VDWHRTQSTARPNEWEYGLFISEDDFRKNVTIERALASPSTPDSKSRTSVLGKVNSPASSTPPQPAGAVTPPVNERLKTTHPEKTVTTEKNFCSSRSIALLRDELELK
jgi:hypothetical protein